MPCYRDMNAGFVNGLVKFAQEFSGKLLFKFVIGDSLVPHARNRLSGDFMKTDCTHCLFIDSGLCFKQSMWGDS